MTQVNNISNAAYTASCTTSYNQIKSLFPVTIEHEINNFQSLTHTWMYTFSHIINLYKTDAGHQTTQTHDIINFETLTTTCLNEDSDKLQRKLYRFVEKHQLELNKINIHTKSTQRISGANAQRVWQTCGCLVKSAPQTEFYDGIGCIFCVVSVETWYAVSLYSRIHALRL